MQQGIRVLTHLDRLSIAEETLLHIDSSFKGIEAWIKLIITFGVGTVTLGLGALVLRVIYNDIEANEEMQSYIEKLINKAGEKTKLVFQNTKLEMEIVTRGQLQDGIEKRRKATDGRSGFSKNFASESVRVPVS